MRIVQLTTDARDHYRNYSAPIPYFGTAPEALLEGFAPMPDIEIHVVSCTHEPVAAPLKLMENIWFHSVRVPKWGWMRTLYTGCVLATRRKIREIRPDIVHGQGTEKDCAISAVMSGFPNVVTLHGIMKEQAKLINARVGSFYWLASRVEAFALRKTAGVFCNSQYTETAVEKLARRKWRVPNAVREKFFQELPPTAKPAKPVLLNIGLVCPRKRQNELIAALGRLETEKIPFEIHFLGEAVRGNPYGGRFYELLEKHKDFSRFAGFKNTDQLIAYFDASSAVVHVPSEETFGLVVAEALARNLKFFGFRVGGVSDISSGVDGVELFTDGDWIGLVNAIARWVHGNHPQPTLAAETMRQRYHPSVIAARHLEIYREVLNKRA